MFNRNNLPTTRRSPAARRAVGVAVALAVPLALSACGDDDTASDKPAAASTAPNGDVYNAADVDFATQMMPHHADALVMVDMTQGRRLSLEFVALTERIREAQAPEIELMTDWLTAWGEEVPETSRDHANSHGEHMPGMEGMDLEALEPMNGEAFEEMWLEMMIEHHEGAVEMAEDQIEDGVFEPAIEMAEAIAASQAAEIEEMQQMIDG